MIGESLLDSLRKFRILATRGPDHRRRLSNIDTRIVVSGTRGKSGTTKRLHDIFIDRGYDTVAKITGNRPHILHNGERHEIERGSRVTMYENAREIARYTPDDVLVVENQAITEYTNWVVNDFYVKPHVIVIPNIRQDHLDTLGGDRESIARSLTRSIPPGIHVVNAEQNPKLQQYIDREVSPRAVTVTHVEVPEEHQHILAAESVYALAEVVRIVGSQPLSEDRIQQYLDEMQVSWTWLDNGRVYNAADVNDVESTEAVRQALQYENPEPLTVFMYLRYDRRSRSAAFLDYLGELASEGIVEEVHVAGALTGVFAHRADFQVVQHDEDEETAGEVLDEMVAKGRPVYIVGNTVAEFMRDMETAINDRKRVNAPLDK